MRLRMTTLVEGVARDVVVEAEPTATVAELGDALALPARALSGADPRAEIVNAGVFEGVIVPRTRAMRLPVGAWRIEFVGGPFGGETVGLPAGSTITVGSAPEMLVRILDPSVDGHHATVVAGASLAGNNGPSATLRRVSDRGPVLVNGEPLEEEREIGPDDLVQIGSSLIRLGRAPAPSADITADGSGRLAFNRGSRIRPEPPQPRVKLPGDKPTESDRTSIPWIAALLPVVMGIAMATMMHSPRYLLFAFMSPVMVVSSHLMNRKNAKRTGKRTAEKWREEVIDARGQIARLSSQQRTRSWRERLDPVALADVAFAPTTRLWERRLTDSDAIQVRIGVGDVDLEVAFEGKRLREDGLDVPIGVSPSPIVVDLQAGPVGIAGPRPVTGALARSMLMQLAVTRSPRDLRIVVLCEDSAEAQWAWIRWLPHCDGGAAAFAMIGNTDETRAARIREVCAVVESRLAAEGERSPDSHLVVFMDQARTYRMIPGMMTILDQGPSVGVYVVATEEDRSRLPQETATEVLVEGSDLTMARMVARTGGCDAVLLDGLRPTLAEEIARAIAPITHATGVGDASLLPPYARFVDLVGLDLDDPQPIMRRWSRPRGETSAIVGAGLHGPFSIDLAADGPHALVAGTTGAGKSEFLQTLVVSLALRNRPDALNFVFVDYKGGAAFADCENLPHTVGMVTNLDGRGTERALEALDAELKRRETVLREMGAKDADAAWEKNPTLAAELGLARFVLVIDEFAELKHELPDFITGLIRIARVGRSLGMHLILATQRPAGSITGEMQSNTNLRVALRVTDSGDSTDVLGSGEAALISPSTPGRGYARRGAGAAPTGFQTARVAGRRPGTTHRAAEPPAVVGMSWWQLGVPVEFPHVDTEDGPVDHDDTDLRAIVHLMNDAARGLAIPQRPSPWLDPLPSVVEVDAIPASETPGAIIVALEDIPSQQAQRGLEWNYQSDSHVVFIGGPQSGRTSVLRTMAAQMAQHPAEDLHLYAIDWGNGALKPLADLPHCGAVVTPTEVGRVDRLTERIVAEIGDRQQRLAEGAYGSIAEQRRGSPYDAMPYLVILIDAWERYAAEYTSGAQDDQFRAIWTKIMREGPAVGIRVVMTGDRTTLGDRTAKMIDTTYLLRLAQREDYASGGASSKGLPDVIPPGRLYWGTAPLHEAQVALLAADATGEAQHRAFQSIIAAAHTARAVEPADRPFRVDVLPTLITVQEARQLPVMEGCPPDGVLIGVGGDTLSQLRITFEDDAGLIVAGDRRRGRSTALATILVQAVEQRRGVVAVGLRDSVFTRTAARLGVPVLADPSPEPEEFVLPIRQARELAAESGYQTALVLCDDVDFLRGTGLDEVLASNATKITFGVAAPLEDSVMLRPAAGHAKRGQRGLLLSSRVTSGGVPFFGAYLPAPLVGRFPPGRAAWFQDGEYRPVQVPVLSQATPV